MLNDNLWLNDVLFGIVQGRLTTPPNGELQWFPQNEWSLEFDYAKDIGLNFIELLVERQFNDLNPFWSDEGRKEILSRARETGRMIYSACTDYIIDNSLIGPGSEGVKRHVGRFLEAASDLGCSVIILPLLEESNLTSDNLNHYVPLLRDFSMQAADANVTVCVESLLNGSDLKVFMEKVDRSNVKCVFDTGNRVVDNEDLASEIYLLGSWISHVHLKDKNKHGENVLMGTGLVNFLSIFKVLEQISYGGPFVFETTRGSTPILTAKYHLNLSHFFMHESRL